MEARDVGFFRGAKERMMARFEAKDADRFFLFKKNQLRFMNDKFFTIVILLFGYTPIAILAQESTQPTPPKVEIHSLRWALHTGISFQKAFFVEIGPAFIDRGWNNETLMGGDVIGYGAFEWSPVQKIYGGKVGFDIVPLHVVDFGLELKYLTDNEVEALIITLKAGLVLKGFIINYGYSFSTNKFPFEAVGKHQVALSFNLHKKHHLK